MHTTSQRHGNNIEIISFDKNTLNSAPLCRLWNLITQVEGMKQTDQTKQLQSCAENYEIV